MPRFVLRGSILRNALAVTGLLAFALVQTPIALAQRGGGHVGGGGAHFGGGGHFSGGARMGSPRGFAPAPSRSMISRPRFFPGPFGPRGVPFRHGRCNTFRHRGFFGPRFFRNWGWGFNPYWWPGCGPYSGWGWGLDCYGWGPYGYGGYGFENYVTLPPYEYPPSFYGPADRDLVQLFLKDGTSYYVTDYWFVNNQVHFITLEEDGTKSVEQVIDLDELDLQKSIDVNTRRGFRFVLRDEPLEKYLHDHPDANPPLVTPPQKR